LRIEEVDEFFDHLLRRVDQRLGQNLVRFAQLAGA
jgi:hypothetical protein